MLTYQKDNSFKYIRENSGLIPIIEQDGWQLVTPTPVVTPAPDSPDASLEADGVVYQCTPVKKSKKA